METNGNPRIALGTLRAALLAVITAVTAVAAVGCASASHSSRVQSDREVADRVQGALSRAGVEMPRIEARCYRGVVTLLGGGSPSEIARAEAAVRGVAGVVRVNTLILEKDPSTASGFARSEKAPIVTRTANAGPGQP